MCFKRNLEALENIQKEDTDEENGETENRRLEDFIEEEVMMIERERRGGEGEKLNLKD